MSSYSGTDIMFFLIEKQNQPDFPLIPFQILLYNNPLL